MSRGRKHGVSLGTVITLLLTGVVCACLLFLFGQYGGTLDVPSIMASLQQGQEEKGAAVPTVAVPTEKPLAAASQTLQPSSQTGGTFTLTAGGSICLDTAVRQSGYYSDVKAYDFTDVFSLLKSSFSGNVNLVTLENLMDASQKVSDLIAPDAAVSMLTTAGIDTVSVGFAKAYDKGASVLRTTVDTLQAKRLRVLGTAAAGSNAQIVKAGGVLVGMVAYTDNTTSAGKKKLKKDGAEQLLPTTEQAVQDIALLHGQGAQVVVVSVSWGSAGKSAVTKAQRETAQALADAGADIILGTGTRTVQPAAWLTSSDGRQVLCVYSLGTLLSEDRSNSQVAGALLHLTLRVASNGELVFETISYTPTFIWRYKFGSSYQYRVISSSEDAPAGMDDSQTAAMQRARETTMNALGREVAFE